MSDVVYDCEAWTEYPQHRWLFNKLELALKLGYIAGPAGLDVPDIGEYIVRPIYNLSGMGVNARKMVLNPNDVSLVKPGEFWCEFFHGPNISIDYEWKETNGLIVPVPIHAAQSFRVSHELYRFTSWKKIFPPNFLLPQWIWDLRDVPRFNIEFIRGNIIEIHLRSGIDFPEGSTDIIPVWDDMTQDDCVMFFRKGFKYIEHYDDADGHLKSKRLGFFYR